MGFELPDVAHSALTITAATAAALAVGSYVVSKGTKTLPDENDRKVEPAVLQPPSFWTRCNTPLVQKFARYATIATGMGVFGYCNFDFVKNCYTSTLSGLYFFGQQSQACYNATSQVTMDALKYSATAGAAFALGRASNSHQKKIKNSRVIVV